MTNIEQSIQSILRGASLQESISNLLESDAGSESKVRQLKADIGDRELWLRTINALKRREMVLEINISPSSMLSRLPRQFWIFDAQLGDDFGKTPDAVVLKYYYPLRYGIATRLSHASTTLEKLQNERILEMSSVPDDEVITRYYGR